MHASHVDETIRLVDQRRFAPRISRSEKTGEVRIRREIAYRRSIATGLVGSGIQSDFRLRDRLHEFFPAVQEELIDQFLANIANIQPASTDFPTFSTWPDNPEEEGIRHDKVVSKAVLGRATYRLIGDKEDIYTVLMQSQPKGRIILSPIIKLEYPVSATQLYRGTIDKSQGSLQGIMYHLAYVTVGLDEATADKKPKFNIRAEVKTNWKWDDPTMNYLSTVRQRDNNASAQSIQRKRNAMTHPILTPLETSPKR